MKKKNLTLSSTTWNSSLTPCQNLEKTNAPISRKRASGLKDGQTFILWDTSGYRWGSNKSEKKSSIPKMLLQSYDLNY